MKLVPWFFALLVTATVAAFFISQRLKSTPPAVQSVVKTDEFSPNVNGLRDEAVFSFRLKKDDLVTVTVVDDHGTPVKEIADDLTAKAYRRVRVTWDGRRDNGEIAPDGVYRYRVGLAKQGRSVTVPVSVKLDNTPPQPLVTAIGPKQGKGPEILPLTDSGKVSIKFRGPTVHTPEALIYRVRQGREPELVQQVKGQAGESTIEWDGKVAGKQPKTGNYLAAVKLRDRAGNYAISQRQPLTGESGIPGRGGIVVRPLAVRWIPKTLDVGEQAVFKVDARGRSYRYSIRRIGKERPSREGKGSDEKLRIRMPSEGISNLYLLKVTSGSDSVTVPIPVQARKKQRVLMVMPAVTWQSSNPVDENGDGTLDTLETRQSIKQRRYVYTDTLLGQMLDQSIAFTEFVNRKGYRYDVTTDLDLANGDGPPLSRYRAVVFPGQTRWFPEKVGSQIRKYVLDGGKAFVPSGGSFTDRVEVTKKSITLSGNSSQRDVFGLKSELVKAENPVDITAFINDKVDLFKGTDGLYPNWSEYEPIESFDRRAEQLAAAGVDDQQPVIAAFKLGRGFVVRTGLPAWNSRLSSVSSREAETTSRIWSIISKRQIEEVG